MRILQTLWKPQTQVLRPGGCCVLVPGACVLVRSWRLGLLVVLSWLLAFVSWASEMALIPLEFARTQLELLLKLSESASIPSELAPFRFTPILSESAPIPFELAAVHFWTGTFNLNWHQFLAAVSWLLALVSLVLGPRPKIQGTRPKTHCLFPDSCPRGAPHRAHPICHLHPSKKIWWEKFRLVSSCQWNFFYDSLGHSVRPAEVKITALVICVFPVKYLLRKSFV